MNQVEVDFVLFGEARSYEQATKILITDDTGYTPCIKSLRAEASNGNSDVSKVCYSKFFFTQNSGFQEAYF